MKKNLRDMDLFTVFHFRDERARGRCVMLASAVFSLLATNLCMSGTLYTVFLTANHFSIVDTGVLGFLVPIASCFSVFSPLLLALLRLLVLPIPFCLLFLMYERGAELVWWAFPLAECITAVVSVPILLRTFRKKTMPSA